MPSSPIAPGAITRVASPENSSPSALTISTWMVSAMFALRQCLCFLDCFFDAADHVERLLGQVIVFAGDDRLEAADRVLQRDDLAVLAGEHFRDIEGLRQEALNLARAIHGLLVLFRELVHAENRDDVLQLLVTLQHL